MVARVTLKGARTYNLGGKRWIKDVPQLVRGEDDTKTFEQNGYFRVHVLKEGSKEAKKAKKVLKAEKKASKRILSKKKSTKKKTKGKLGKLKK